MEQAPAANVKAVKDARPSDDRQIWEVKGEEREQLDALSKEVFGATSRWQSLVRKGFSELITEEVQEYVPGETAADGTVGEGFTRMVQVPVKRKDGAHQSVHKRHDIRSVTIYMLERKAQLDKIKAEIKRIQDEEKAKKDAAALAKKVNAEASGSAV